MGNRNTVALKPAYTKLSFSQRPNNIRPSVNHSTRISPSTSGYVFLDNLWMCVVVSSQRSLLLSQTTPNYDLLKICPYGPEVPLFKFSKHAKTLTMNKMFPSSAFGRNFWLLWQISDTFPVAEAKRQNVILHQIVRASSHIIPGSPLAIIVKRLFMTHLTQPTERRTAPTLKSPLTRNSKIVEKTYHLKHVQRCMQTYSINILQGTDITQLLICA